ncbi:unnamed protein product [Allacma fusca]|uniref:Uncharacterized protein n=1 Tax=Allacma fusca TaxID=39272 RepID=A0A8J2K6Q2_9HEXA|nr:unnamed protein product [Allacma fusca]
MTPVRRPSSLNNMILLGLIYPKFFEIVEHKKETPSSKVTFVPQSLRKEDRPEKTVTSEMINEKLAKAEERRKQQEEEKKARAVTSKPRPSRREEEKEELRIMQMEKWEAGIRNRELQLLGTQEKLREKHQRIKGVNFKKSFKGMDPFDNDSD